jgi:predicted ATPase/DNA-binding SARP family transcriptional activator
MHDLSITLFGASQIKRGENQTALQRRKDFALLVYLTVTAQPHSRDTLATLLWPESEQSVSRANLRKNLSRLRSDLGEETLQVLQDQVGLNPKLSIWTDTAEFQSLTDLPKKHNHHLAERDTTLCNECEKSLEKAVGLYQGHFLEGFNLPDSPSFEDWQFFQSEGYKQRLGEALQHLINHCLKTEKYNEAIDYGRKWLALDTLHEPAHRRLMLAYALGGQQAAALRQFDECVRILKEEIGVDPEPETMEMHDAIQKKAVKPQSASIKSPAEPASSVVIEKNLPTHPTPFIGRTKELVEIQKYIEDPSCRLVTLLGPGGSGKTRLASQTGYLFDKANAFNDGVFFVQLAPLTNSNSIIQAIQKQLKISSPTNQDDSRRQLINYLKSRHILLILDNLEHLIDHETISLVTDFISNSQQLKILITTRERLNIQGENVYPVEGLERPTNESILSEPEPDSVTNRFGAIQLFEQSARRVQPSFRATRQNIDSIAKICSYVKGMPLAIELAASWVEVLPVSDIYKEIKESLDFLQSELHDVPDRQRSLRAVFDTSWSKLSKPTRSTIKALSVFRSSFSRNAAQAITGASIKTLLELSNKSWLQPQQDGRYQIHELLRQFAFEILEQDSITYEQVKERYCAYYNGYASTLWIMMKGSNQLAAFSGMEVEFENIRTAWNWLAIKRDYEEAINNILPVLFSYSEIRGKSLELLDMCDKMIKALGGISQSKKRTRAEIILLAVQSAFNIDGHPVRYTFFEGIYPVDQENTKRSWLLAQKTIKLYELGFWGTLLAFNYGHVFGYKDVLYVLQQTIQHFKENNDRWEMANAELHFAMLLLRPGINSDAILEDSIHLYLSEAIDIFNSLGDDVNAGHSLSMMGSLRMKEEKLHEAIQQWEVARSRLLKADVNEWAAASSINWHIGDAYLQMGKFKEAFDRFQEISRVNLEHGFIQQAVGALSKESFEKARYGDLEEAIAIRKQCIELIQETGPEYQLAWNFWEMGELMRLTGNFQSATKWFERAHEIFKKHQDSIGMAFYWRGVGDLSLLANDLQTAKQYFETCEQVARIGQHNWMTIYSLSSLSIIKLKSGDMESAASDLTEALRLAQKVHDPGITLKIIANVAELLAFKNQTESSIELSSFVLTHFASWNEIERQSSELMSSLKSKLLPREFNDAKKNGQTFDLWKTVDRLALKS